jgi:hypothetical protein|tara:strand:+ start:86 stop:331 length:246 start_codon:yes stop_codon:yes gene_type:complete
MEFLDHMSWALKNGIRVYPIPVKEYYTTKVANKKRNMCKVKLCVEINNAKHMGQEVYKQDTTLTDKVAEIYKHYYDNHKTK